MKATVLSGAWAGFWESRTAREKVLLTWGGAALAVAIGWSVLWAPAADGRAQLRERMPRLQRELAQMTAQANEARSLAGQAAGVAPAGAALKDAMTASLGEHDLQDAQVRLIGTTAQVQLENAAFAAVTAWLNDVRRQFKVEVIEAHVMAQKPDGQVDLSVLLQPANVQ
ncbi:MAG: type II secretion system protein M [Paraburkholderia sp.]|uniref:type II secretion system protein M n=1 Tax=Paraburkholderia sp. TaxID=1926495 RepID=UPI00120B241B|nr:type II secretion system protein M [Paraburkholderia sp.]TAM02596.1 MAG: type II secretion system protein M [Paraburkholderia sp.]TAM28702.1 MAG: type II secretion system protein M [Paraburkholderia sp.]